MPLCPAVAALLDRFHTLKPVRAWSLIITLYGDAVVPRGGRLWLGSLTEIMDLFGIDDGWLAGAPTHRAQQLLSVVESRGRQFRGGHATHLFRRSARLRWTLAPGAVGTRH